MTQYQALENATRKWLQSSISFVQHFDSQQFHRKSLKENNNNYSRTIVYFTNTS